MEKIKLFQKELKNGSPLIWGKRNFHSVMTSTGAKTTKDEADGDTHGKCVCSFYDDLNGHTMYYCKPPKGYSVVGKGGFLVYLLNSTRHATHQNSVPGRVFCVP